MALRKKVLMAASGDLRQSANETCWPAQEAMEKQVTAALAAFGVEVERAHPYDPALKHGFIASQKEGMEVFARIDPQTPIIVAEAVWQYSHHVLPGLIGHRGADPDRGQLVRAMAGPRRHAQPQRLAHQGRREVLHLWSENFTDESFRTKLAPVAEDGRGHARRLPRPRARPGRGARRGPARSPSEIADDFRRRKAIMGIFDEGCMGMYNAIIPDELLFPLGVFKERLSQSALYAATRRSPTPRRAPSTTGWSRRA